MFFNRQMKLNERNIDIVVERVEIVDYGTVPNNVMGRICVPKDGSKMGSSRFLINIYSFMDKPIFNVLVIDTQKDNKNLVKYDAIQSIQKDMYGKSFLCKNEKMYLNAVIPNLSNYDGIYKLVLQFENEHGDIFQKVVTIKVNSKFYGLIQSYNSENSKLHKENQGV